MFSMFIIYVCIMNIPVACLLVLPVFTDVLVSAANGTEAKNLHTQLFSTNGYNKKIRPRINQSDVIDVTVHLSIVAINDLSEVKETLKTTAYLSVYWHDDYLVWNDTEYGGLYFYQWPQADIWKPDVVLKNSVLDYKELGVDTLNVEIYSDGEIRWYPFQVFESTCMVDITYYPFDTQHCEMKFVAWSYTSTEVAMHSNGSGVYLADYQSNAIWEYDGSSWETKNESAVSSIIFTIDLRRKPQHVILSVIMPILMLAVLNIFVFVLPCESGERASYAITVFLAFAVFLTIVSTTLPENSNSVAIFSVFLILQTIQSTMITMIALLMIRVSGFDENVPVPNFVQTTMRFLTCKTCFRKNKTDIIRPLEKENCPEILTVDETDETYEKQTGEKEKGDATDSVWRDSDTSPVHYSWKLVVRDLDRIFFVFFIILFTLSFIICGSVAAS